MDDTDLLMQSVGPLGGRRGGKFSQRSGKWRVLCPAHADKNPSLDVGVAPPDSRWRLTWHCYAGCSIPEIRRASIAAGVPPEAFDSRNGQTGNGRRRIIDVYPYTDDDGNVLYEKVRYTPKAFQQRRSDGNGGHIWNLDGIPRVLYRLPESRKAVEADQWIAVVESEKSVNRLVRDGFHATCATGGAGQWLDEYVPVLAGAKVAVLPDADEEGRSHANQVARSL